MMRLARLPALMLAATLCSSTAVLAQEGAATGHLTIEINELAPSEKGCKLTFVADNGLPQSLARLSFEFVLFDAKGLVERMAVLDFRDVPAGKTKVRQFDLPGTKCGDVSSLLINDAPVCEGEGIAPGACMKALKTGSKSTIALKG